MFASRVAYLSKLVFKFSRRVECLDEDLDTPTRTPVPVLLKTNRSPSDEERQVIKANLLIARERVAKLQVQLEQSSLSSNPNWLDTFRDLAETESFIHKHECILSAFRTFPNEILILIFLACLPDVEHEPLYPRHEPLRPRKWHTIPSFQLSQVCKNWRDLVIHTPRMWTILGNVALEQHTTIPRKKHKSYLSHLDYFDFIKMLLKRSGDLDLWISISSTSPKSYTNSKAEYPVLALLIEHKDRWAALGIRASFQTVKAICNSEQAETYSRPFKRLRKLCLGITWGPYDSTIDISRASLLTEVSIPRVFCPESVPALSYPNVILPFEQLRVYRETTLPISLQPTDTLIQEVRTGGKLEELEILTPDGCFFYLHHHKPEPMNLESLKTLALRMDPHTDHYDFVELADSSKSLFDMLSLPNLETLKLSGSGVLDPSLASFIRCPSPQASLRKLCLRKLGLSAGHLSKLLQVTPNLEELITDLPEQGDLNRLAAGRSGVGTSVANTTVALLVPKLRGLVFHLRAYEVTYTLLRRHERRPILLLAPAVVEGESIKDGVDWDMAHSSTVEPYFRLVLPDAEAAKDAQVDLNMDNYDENADSEGHHDSPEPAGMNTDENTALRNKLFHFRMMLRQALSELKRATTSPLRPQFASDLNTLLQEIEALKLTQGRQIANLYVTWLHSSILSLSNVEQKLVPEEKKFLFRERAKRLITKWNLIITSDLKNRKIHWAIKGQRSIVYIGRDDVCHGLPQIKDTVYDGLEDNQSSLMDIMWPDPIF